MIFSPLYGLLIWAIIWGVIGALVAPRKGWTPAGGFALCAVFSIFGVAYLATREDVGNDDARSSAPPALNTARYCGRCGSPAPLGGQFCAQCGNDLAAPVREQPSPAWPSAQPPTMPAPPAHEGRSTADKVGISILLIVVVVIVAGYLSQRGAATLLTGPAGVNLVDTGTWELSLNATTCGDFHDKMTITERDQVSRSLLQIVRSTTLPNAPAFSDTLAYEFQQAIGSECSQTATGPTYPIVAAAALVYTLQGTTYQPSYRP